MHYYITRDLKSVSTSSSGSSCNDGTVPSRENLWEMFCHLPEESYIVREIIKECLLPLIELSTVTLLIELATVTLLIELATVTLLVELATVTLLSVPMTQGVPPAATFIQ